MLISLTKLLSYDQLFFVHSYIVMTECCFNFRYDIHLIHHYHVLFNLRNEKEIRNKSVMMPKRSGQFYFNGRQFVRLDGHIWL